MDWLAVELMERGWSLKALHRTIVTSNAYRMQTSVRESAGVNVRLDPENRTLWRMNVRRLEAEAVRDNLLSVAGILDLAEGGPDLDPATGETSAAKPLLPSCQRKTRAVPPPVRLGQRRRMLPAERKHRAATASRWPTATSRGRPPDGSRRNSRPEVQTARR